MKGLKYLFLISPYLAVFAGLYVFHNAWTSLLIYHAFMASALLLYRRDIALIDLFSLTNRFLACGLVLLCLSSGVILYCIWPWLQLPGSDLHQSMLLLGLRGWPAVTFLIYFSTMHPVLEELFWRYLYDFRARFISPGDVMFALYHGFVLTLFIRIEFVILCVIGLVLVARVWRYLKQQRGDHLLVFLSHGAADFSIFLGVMMLN